MKILSLILSLVLCAACTSSHESSDSDEVLVGYRLIDQGKSNEAIEHFQILVERDQDSDEYRRGLSSAYALRGGFKIQNLIQPMKEVEAADKNKEEVQNLVNSLIEKDPVFAELKKFVGVHMELLVFIRKFQAVPTASVAEREDLQLSMSVLRSMKVMTQGDYLYMAILKTLILKSNLVHSPAVEFETCDDMFHLMQKRLVDLYSDYGQILSFLNNANPSREDQYAEQLKAIDNLVLETSTLTSVSVKALFLLDNAKESEAKRFINIAPQCFK